MHYGILANFIHSLEEALLSFVSHQIGYFHRLLHMVMVYNGDLESGKMYMLPIQWVCIGTMFMIPVYSI